MADHTIHQVQQGESLSGIARDKGVSLSALLAANPEITDPDRIKVGQRIKIPSLVVVDPGPPPAAGAGSGPSLNAVLGRLHTGGASDRTARQDGLPQRGIRGVLASEAMAATDRTRVMRHRDKFVAAGKKFGLPPALLAAIASRESRGGNVLAADGTGDGGHGFGIMQVDDRNDFAVVRTGGPSGQRHIDQATGILKDKLEAVKRKFPDLAEEKQLATAVSRYNGGRGRAHPESDLGTTGSDYMNDVWARAQFYARVETWT
jgi:LysM repeat protein